MSYPLIKKESRAFIIYDAEVVVWKVIYKILSKGAVIANEGAVNWKHKHDKVKIPHEKAFKEKASLKLSIPHGNFIIFIKMH